MMRILIAGLGAIGQRHARNLRRLCGDSLELLAFRQRRLRHVINDSLEMDQSRDPEEELGIQVFSSLDDALARSPVATVVCTPTSQHLAIAQAAAKVGSHLFIEKPVSHSLDGVMALKRSVEARGLVAAVGCQWRYHPLVGWLRELLQRGDLGPLVRAEIDYAEYLPDWHPYEDYRTSYAARASLGGGVVLTQIHDLDLAWWLFGPFTRVAATGGRLGSLDIDVEDTVHAELQGGCVPVTLRQTFAGQAPRRSVTIEGSRGTLAIDLRGGRVEGIGDPPAPPVMDAFTRNDMFLGEMRQFLSCITAGARPFVPLADGIAVLRLALAVKCALHSGRPVMIEEDLK